MQVTGLRPGRLIALVVAGLAIAASPAAAGKNTTAPAYSAAGCRRAAGDAAKTIVSMAHGRKGDHAYVEFRQRNSRQLLPGHLYVVFGRLDASGRPLTREVIGLYPDRFLPDAATSSDGWIGAHVMPSSRDCTYEARLAYRVTLSVERYKRVRAKAEALRRHPPRWNLTRYNCHDFAMEFARIAGLRRGGGSVVPSAVWLRSFIRENEQASR
jgi:hypothetical protein